MIINSTRLVGCPVLSLHVGGQIASVTELIIDPNTLKLIACRVDGPLVGKEMGEILPMESVREFSRLGMIVDSGDELVGAEDIVRIKQVIELDFSLIGLKVETKKGHKLGKVIDYTLIAEDWQVHQLVVHRPAIKSLIDPELLVSRSEIAEVTDYKVIVKDAERKANAKADKPTDFVPNFINPFREPDFASENKLEQQ